MRDLSKGIHGKCWDTVSTQQMTFLLCGHLGWRLTRASAVVMAVENIRILSMDKMDHEPHERKN